MNATEIRELMKKNLRNGLTREELELIAKKAEAEVAAELTREDEIAAARKKAAEAMCEYMNALKPESNMAIEEAYQLMEACEEMYDLCVPETVPTIKVYTGDEAKAKAESLVGDFESFIKSIGF